MPSWLSRLQDALSGQAGDAIDVREALSEAQRACARVELEPVTPTTTRSCIMRTTIEVVDDEGFVISQPVAGGRVRPLARFEPHHLRVMTRRGLLAGETHALGRARIPNGADGVLYGYRLCQPDELRLLEARQPLRALFGRDPVLEAELHVLGRAGAIHGLVEDISEHGARLTCRNAGNDLLRGGDALFKASLPEPVGTIQQMVRIVGVEPARARGALRVRISFDEPNDALADAIRNAMRRGMRRAG